VAGLTSAIDARRPVAVLGYLVDRFGKSVFQAL
jgi:hypothetical protein